MPRSENPVRLDPWQEIVDVHFGAEGPLNSDNDDDNDEFILGVSVDFIGWSGSVGPGGVVLQPYGPLLTCTGDLWTWKLMPGGYYSQFGQQPFLWGTAQGGNMYPDGTPNHQYYFEPLGDPVSGQSFYGSGPDQVQLPRMLGQECKIRDDNFDPPVFTSLGVKYLDTGVFTWIPDLDRNNIGIPEWFPHSLRPAFIGYMLEMRSYPASDWTETT